MRAKPLLLLLVLLAAGIAAPVGAAELFTLHWTIFAQAGWAEREVRSYAVGAQRPLRWQTRIAGFNIRPYAELTLARWLADPASPAAEDRFSQIGVAPVLRLQRPMRSANFFIDAGIGAYVITPKFQLDGKRFGTEFNFGDQIGFGLQLRRSALHEISVRVQHFSNGGIELPNPGENFLQLRYSVSFAS